MEGKLRIVTGNPLKRELSNTPISTKNIRAISALSVTNKAIKKIDFSKSPSPLKAVIGGVKKFNVNVNVNVNGNR